MSSADSSKEETKQSVIETLQSIPKEIIDQLKERIGVFGVVDVADSNVFDIVVPWRNEEIHTVPAAECVNNIFSNIKVPQCPYMGLNNWSSPHCDGYCSESLSIKGPTKTKLKLIKQYNPYGFSPIMVCNQHDQMITCSNRYGIFKLITFDSNCNILTANMVNRLTLPLGSFGGGYFYLNHKNDTIVVENTDRIACYNTSDKIQQKDKIYELQRKWCSASLKTLMKGKKIEVANVYASLPVWNGNGNQYWVLMPGRFDEKHLNTKKNPVEINAFIAVLEITPDESVPDFKCTTKLLDYYLLENEWVNNTITIDEYSMYTLTNRTRKTDDGKWVNDEGSLIRLSFNPKENKIYLEYKTDYANCGYKKKGTQNIGSGTTATLLSSNNELKEQMDYVTYGDNDNPYMNVIIANRKTGKVISKTPVFAPMRSADEASFIGINGRIVVENNFGHDISSFPRSQKIENEPGMAMINADSRINNNNNNNKNKNNNNKSSDIIWYDDRNCYFAMNMLCRESGIIFAYIGDWNDVEMSVNNGGMYYVAAIDSYDGRIIWKIPIGRGKPYKHPVGGIYFNRKTNQLFVGTYNYLVSIQNWDHTKYPL